MNFFIFVISAYYFSFKTYFLDIFCLSSHLCGTVRGRDACLFQEDMEIFKIEKDVVQAGCPDFCRGF